VTPEKVIEAADPSAVAGLPNAAKLGRSLSLRFVAGGGSSLVSACPVASARYERTCTPRRVSHRKTLPGKRVKAHRARPMAQLLYNGRGAAELCRALAD